MIFLHPWFLLLALAPLLWAAFELRHAASRMRLWLRAVTFSLVLIALAEPRLQVNENKVAVAILADTSASLSTADLERASNIASSIESRRGRNWTRVIPFARVPRAPVQGELDRGWRLRYTTGENGAATDLEAAVREAIASLPSGMVPRVALLSDGNENEGSVARAAWQAKELGVPIDTYALAGRPRPNLRLESVSMPPVAFTGERFPVELTVSSPRKASGEVEIKAEGKSLGSSKVALEPGDNAVRVYASIATPGSIDLSGVVRAGDLGETRFERAISLRRPKLLYLSQDPVGSGQHFLETLAAAQFDIIQQGDLPLTQALNAYQVIVLNNWDLDGIAPQRKLAFQEYVKQGGGLLVIGGEKNIYKETKTEDDALEVALPAKLAPPRSPEGIAVALIIDKSSSMEGRKIELARLAAIGVIENLKPVDMVGVLIFDNNFQWAVPMRRAEDRSLIKRLVAGITPDGGTQIAPALSEAFRRISPTKAAYKHIVLLTDGISEEGDSVALARDAAAQKVTISTVGLGQDVNRAYLEKVAATAKGKAYFLNEPSGLEQILLKDVMEHTGSTAVEKPVTPTVIKRADVLDGVNIETAPPLKGYVKFSAKPTADMILQVEGKDPLLARWQFGLGRSAVFTSDAKSRWAEAWVSWKGFDRFWTNVTRDLLPHAQAGEATAEYNSANGNLVVEYRLARHVVDPTVLPDIFVFGPEGFQRPVPVKKVAAGVFRGEAPLGDRQGLFRVRPAAELAAFPEVGLYREQEELSQYGSNEALLKQIAAFTGGRFQPAPDEVFTAGNRFTQSQLSLWPALLGAAIVVSLAELLARKWRGILNREKGSPA